MGGKRAVPIRSERYSMRHRPSEVSTAHPRCRTSDTRTSQQITDSLTNVDGLSSLTSVGRRLTLYSNNALTNVDGLSSLTLVGGDVSLTTNAALTRCCGLFPLLNRSGVGGTVEISGNGAGCNSAQDILDGGRCVVAVDKTTWGSMKRSYR